MKKKFLDNKVHRGLVFFSVFIPLLFFSMYQAWGADVMIVNSQSGFLNDSITYEHYIEDSTADSSGLLCTSCYGITDTLTISANQFHSYFLYYWTGGIAHRGTDEYFHIPTDTTSLNASPLMPIRAYWQDSATSAGHRLWTYSEGAITAYEEVTPVVGSTYAYRMNIPTVNTSEYLLSIDINYPGVDTIVSWTWGRNIVSLGGSPFTPSDSNLCNVNGYVYDASYNVVRYANVIFEIENIKDTCSNIIIPKVRYTVQTNSSGYFTKDLLFTDCMVGNKKWKVHAEYIDGSGNFVSSINHQFTLPSDSTSYRLVF